MAKKQLTAEDFLDRRLTAKECKILSCYARLNKSPVNATDLLSNNNMNTQDAQGLVDKGLLDRSKGFRSRGRSPDLFTATDLGEELIDLMKVKEIQVV